MSYDNYNENSYDEDDYGENDYSENDYSEQGNNDYELKQEINIFDRIGGVGDLMITSDSITQDPSDHFKLKVNAIARNLIENRNVNLNENDITVLLDKVEKIKEKGFNIGFINPSAYILGYIASNGGTGIVLNNITKVFQNVLKLVDSVTEPDVVRYARFWINLEKK